MRCRAVVVGRRRRRPSPPCSRAKQGYTGTTQVQAPPPAPRASHRMRQARCRPQGGSTGPLVAPGSTGRTTWTRFKARRCAPVSISRTQVLPPPPTGLAQAAEEHLLQRGWCSSSGGEGAARARPCSRAKQGYTANTQVLTLPPAPRASHAPGGVQAAGRIDGLTRRGRTTRTRFTARRGALMSISRTTDRPDSCRLLRNACSSGARSGWCAYTCLSPHDA
ncbi:hypothetical protein DFH08DRAFT_442595 [Mycena albidolilacea]|uniref:Uncharacterized protein n=1 Tax=Mycena albidolilacea TaxID=1033008 RepID=A0AAD7AH03_9AGAR|nr:hypothetical protein DFH08DRAFT_442595 [Mycena albidolilacea]